MIFYINPLITTKNTYGTHTHTHKDTGIKTYQYQEKKKEEEETQRKTARGERGTK